MTIETFVKSIEVRPEYIDALTAKLREKLNLQLMSKHDESVTIDLRVANLKDQIRSTITRLSATKSETVIKYIEESIEAMEAEIVELRAKRQEMPEQTPNDFDKAISYLRYFLEKLDLLLLNYDNPVLQARFFRVIFNEAPTYETIVSGTPDLSQIKEANSLFRTRTPLNNSSWLGMWVRNLEYKNRNSTLIV